MKVKDLEIRSPCCESWDEMRGTQTRRFCDVCEKDVFNLSVMSEAEVQHLFATRRRPCIRYTYDESDSIVFTHPQVRRQQRGVERLLRAAAMALPLALLVPIADVQAQEPELDDLEAWVAEIPDDEMERPIWEQAGYAVLNPKSDEDAEDDGDTEESDESSDDAQDDGDTGESDDDEERSRPLPRPPDKEPPLMGEPPPPGYDSWEDQFLDAFTL